MIKYNIHAIQPVVLCTDCSPAVDGQGGLCEDDRAVVAVEQDRRPLAEQIVGLEEGWSKQAECLDGQGHGAVRQVRGGKGDVNVNDADKDVDDDVDEEEDDTVLKDNHLDTRLEAERKMTRIVVGFLRNFFSQQSTARAAVLRRVPRIAIVEQMIPPIVKWLSGIIPSFVKEK